ncbi:MAG: hypothetical protein F6K26_21050 [Moorea sp. SIO2I5]|nr:hypothetical protein [Moorena sp. SIO2I5]
MPTKAFCRVGIAGLLTQILPKLISAMPTNQGTHGWFLNQCPPYIIVDWWALPISLLGVQS